VLLFRKGGKAGAFCRAQRKRADDLGQLGIHLQPGIRRPVDLQGPPPLIGEGHVLLFALPVPDPGRQPPGHERFYAFRTHLARPLGGLQHGHHLGAQEAEALLPGLGGPQPPGLADHQVPGHLLFLFGVGLGPQGVEFPEKVGQLPAQVGGHQAHRGGKAQKAHQLKLPGRGLVHLLQGGEGKIPLLVLQKAL
jgi:hypothetical protein